MLILLMLEGRIDRLKEVSSHQCTLNCLLNLGVVIKVMTYVFKLINGTSRGGPWDILKHIQKYVLTHLFQYIFNELDDVCCCQHNAACHLGIYLQILIPNLKILLLVGCILFFFGKECGALMDLIMGICLVTAITS